MFGVSFTIIWNGTKAAWLESWRIQSRTCGFRKEEPACKSSQGAGVWAAFIPPPLSPEDPQADSSISPLPHLEAKIRQTHSLARLLTKYAEQLLQEYVSGDEDGGARGLRNGGVQITEVPDL